MDKKYGQELVDHLFVVISMLKIFFARLKIESITYFFQKNRKKVQKTSPMFHKISHYLPHTHILTDVSSQT